MRKFIVLALLAVSVNCHAADIWDMSIMDALKIVQQRRADMLEQQMQEQMRANPAWRGR